MCCVPHTGDISKHKADYRPAFPECRLEGETGVNMEGPHRVKHLTQVWGWGLGEPGRGILEDVLS